MSSLFIWFLLLLSGIVVSRLFPLIQKALLIRWLKKNGAWVIATVTGIQKQMRGEKSYVSERMWEMVPYYYITAQWKDSRTKCIYTFRTRVRGPLPRIYVPGHSVYVLIDPRNPKRYFVEL